MDTAVNTRSVWFISVLHFLAVQCWNGWLWITHNSHHSCRNTLTPDMYLSQLQYSLTIATVVITSSLQTFTTATGILPGLTSSW